MDWVTEQWGTRPVVYAGQGTRDHFRAALQMLSGRVPREIHYAHTGWRQVDEAWLYLHGGGAVGAAGAVTGVRVALSGSLAGYQLPTPPTGHRLRESVRLSLGVADGRLAPEAVAFPVLAATYRSALCSADFSLGGVGRTHVGKSELAALGQQHFGAGMDVEAYDKDGKVVDAAKRDKVPERTGPEKPVPSFELTVTAPAIASVRFSGAPPGGYLVCDEVRFTPRPAPAK